MKRYETYVTFKVVVDARNKNEFDNIISTMRCNFTHIEDDGGERIIDVKLLGNQFTKEM